MTRVLLSLLLLCGLPVAASGCFAPAFWGDGSLKCADTDDEAKRCPPGLQCVAGACYYPDLVPDAESTTVFDDGGTDLHRSDGGSDLPRPSDLLPPIDLTAPPKAVLSWENPNPSFGVQKPNLTMERPFTLINTGTLASAPLTIVLSGDNAFSILSNQCEGLALAPNAKCTVVVRFQPPGKAGYTADLACTTTLGPVAVTLTGAGGDPVALSVTIAGTGQGSVSALSGIACGSGTCDYTVENGSMLTLNASNLANSNFLGWGGDAASCGTTTPCNLTVDGAKHITATFEKKTHRVTLRKLELSGKRGAVTIGTIECGLDCKGVTVSMEHDDYLLSAWAEAGTGSTVVGWPSGCSGRRAECNVTVEGDVTYWVVFGPASNYVFNTLLSVPIGSLGSLGAADALCQTAAASADLPDPGQYVAWLSTESTDARDRLGSARGWLRPDGLPFGDTVESFTTGKKVLYPATLAANGSGQDYGFPVITGTKQDGTRMVGSTCDSWSTQSGTTTALGQSGTGFPGWTESGYSYPCTSIALRIYCFGTSRNSAITVPSVEGRRAFVTVGKLPMTTDLVSKADALCQTESGIAWAKAVVSPLGASAASRFNLTGAWWVHNGLPIAKDGRSLLGPKFGSLIPLDHHFDGSDAGAGSWGWVGSSRLDQPGMSMENCAGFTSTTAWAQVWEFGLTGMGAIATGYCGEQAKILCLED